MKRLRLLAGLATAGLVLLVASPAFGATITTPNTNPFNVPPNSTDTGPMSFLIQASGFTAGQQAFAEICDGVPSTSQGYDTTLHCDNVDSTTGVVVPPSGNVSFDPAQGNGIPIADGPTNGGAFNCLHPGEADPGNGLPSWGSTLFDPANGGGSAPCQLKVSSSVSGNTSDQAFISLILPVPGALVPETSYAVLLPVGALLLLGGGFVALRRRNHSAQAAA